MNHQEYIIQQKAQALLASRTLTQLLEDWDETERQPMSLDLAQAREWIMDELERRDPEALAEWLDSNKADPRPFFLGEADSSYTQEYDTFTDADPGL